MRPNIILLGLMHSWKSRSEDDIESYYNIVHDALTLNFGVGILTVPTGLDIGPSENGDAGPTQTSDLARVVKMTYRGYAKKF